MPPRKKSEKFTDMETNPQEEMDPDSTLTLEATNSPLRVMTSTPNSKLTSSVTGTVTAETKFKTLQSIPIDLENREEEVDISNTSNTVPVSESIIEIVPNESDETEEKEIQDVDDEIDDAEIIPPSPASSSSFRLFSSAKLSFSRNVVLPQCIIPREKAELSPRYVVETPEPPELPKLPEPPELTEISSDSQEIVSEKKTVIALIHAPPKSLMTSDFDSIEGISPINWENSGLNDNVDANSTQGNDIQTSQELNATVTCPIQESQIAPKDEEASVPSADVTISLENSQAVPDPFKDLPVQLSALQALLRKRFRNPFITPTEKLHYKFQRRLGRLKRRPLRPVWTITKRRVSVTPPNIDDNNNSAAVQSCKNDSNDLSQSLLTKELDRSLRNLEREEAGMASEGGSQQCNVSQNDIDVSMSKEFSKISKTSSDSVSVKQELFAPVAASSDGYRSPDSGCEVHNEESCLFVKTEQESSVKDTVETIEDVTPKSETTDLLKGSEEATTCDLLGCSMSDSDDLLENIRSNVAAWVTREEDCNQGPAVDDEPNGQLFPPLLFANPADDVKPNIKSMEESPKMSSSLPKSDPQPKEYIRRSVRLASARNSPLSSSASQSSGTSSRKRRASTSAAVSEYEELKTGSGLVKVARMIVWDEFVKYLPPCWVDLLQEHVRDCNSTRQFLINSNPGGPSPIIICKCSHPRPKCD